MSESVAARHAMDSGLQCQAMLAGSRRGRCSEIPLSAGSLERRPYTAIAESALCLCFCNAARLLALVGIAEKQETSASVVFSKGPTDASA